MLDVPLPLTSSDKQFIRRSQIKPNFASSSACPSEMETELVAGNVFEFESTCATLPSQQDHQTYRFCLRIAKGGQILPGCASDINYWIEQQLQLLTVS